MLKGLLQELAKRLSHFWYILSRAKRRLKIYQKCILLLQCVYVCNAFVQ